MPTLLNFSAKNTRLAIVAIVAIVAETFNPPHLCIISAKYTNLHLTLLSHRPLPLKEAKQEVKPTRMTIKLSIPTSCAAYLGETEGMDKLHGGMRRL